MAATVSPLSCAALVQTPVGNRISHEHFLFACSWRPAREDNLRSLPPSQNPRHLAIRLPGLPGGFRPVGHWSGGGATPGPSVLPFTCHHLGGFRLLIYRHCICISSLFLFLSDGLSPRVHIWFILVLKSKCPGQRIQFPGRLSRGLWESEAAPGACLWSGRLLSLLLEAILFDSCLLPV